MNSRSCKAKGRAAENAVVEYLRSRGIKAERRRLTGCEDCGDVGGWEAVVCEIKDHRLLKLGPWLDELQAEMANADKRFGPGHRGVLVVKRKGYPNAPEKWFAIMPLGKLLDGDGGFMVSDEWNGT